MASSKTDDQKPATVEVDRITRDDIAVLARIQARKLHMKRVPNKQYLTMLVEREKEKAIKNGDWDKAAKI